jgi:hypothetical protein
MVDIGIEAYYIQGVAAPEVGRLPVGGMQPLPIG